MLNVIPPNNNAKNLNNLISNIINKIKNKKRKGDGANPSAISTLEELSHVINKKPSFLTRCQYKELVDNGWEYDADLNSFHFMVFLEEAGGVAMDAFREEDGRLSLYFTDFNTADGYCGDDCIPIETVQITDLINFSRPYYLRATKAV